MDISESAAEDMCIMRLVSFINEMKLIELWRKIILLGSCMEVSSLMPHPFVARGGRVQGHLRHFLASLARPSTHQQLFYVDSE